jgi:hypothetical protein
MDLIDYLDEGPAHGLDIGLDIKEFDPSLLSNFNFRNPEAFKYCITTAGLEEVRAVLAYQLMQKHLLIVATRVNSLMMNTCLKACSELELLRSHAISTPNSTFDVSNAYSRNSDSLSNSAINEMKSKFMRNLSSVVKDVFFDIKIKKSGISNIQIEYNNYLSQV